MPKLDLEDAKRLAYAQVTSAQVSKLTADAAGASSRDIMQSVIEQALPEAEAVVRVLREVVRLPAS